MTGSRRRKIPFLNFHFHVFVSMHYWSFNRLHNHWLAVCTLFKRFRLGRVLPISLILKFQPNPCYNSDYTVFPRYNGWLMDLKVAEKYLHSHLNLYRLAFPERKEVGKWEGSSEEEVVSDLQCALYCLRHDWCIVYFSRFFCLFCVVCDNYCLAGV